MLKYHVLSNPCLQKYSLHSLFTSHPWLYLLILPRVCTICISQSSIFTSLLPTFVLWERTPWFVSVFPFASSFCAALSWVIKLCLKYASNVHLVDWLILYGFDCKGQILNFCWPLSPNMHYKLLVWIHTCCGQPIIYRLIVPFFNWSLSAHIFPNFLRFGSYNFLEVIKNLILFSLHWWKWHIMATC